MCYGSLKFKECRTKRCKRRHLPGTKLTANEAKAKEADVPEKKEPKKQPKEPNASKKVEPVSCNCDCKKKGERKPTKGTRTTKHQQRSQFSREPAPKKSGQAIPENQPSQPLVQPPPTMSAFLGQSQLEQRMLQIEKLLLMRPMFNQSVIPQGVQYSF